MNELQKIVVLIDADNTQLSKLSDVLREISTHGRIVVKRAYGNWQKKNLKNWDQEIKRLAIKAEQQFDYVSGKNATDMALVIDTIELLYTRIYDAFVIVSSDSDFTPLAIKLHESGVYVMGVGEKKTPESFRNACDEFIFLENLSAGEDAAPRTAAAPAPELPEAAVSEAEQPSGRTGDDSLPELHKLLRRAYDAYQDDDGYANLAPVGNFIKRTKPDFDTRSYGHTKLCSLLEAFPERYDVLRVQDEDGAVKMVKYRCVKRRR